MTQEFAALLRKVRRQYGYRQFDLADEICVCPSSVSAWETNRYEPTRDCLDQLARIFPPLAAQFYVASRVLPLELDDESEEQLATILQPLVTTRCKT